VQSLSSWFIPNVLTKRACRQRPEVIPRVAPDGAIGKLGRKSQFGKRMTWKRGKKGDRNGRDYAERYWEL